MKTFFIEIECKNKTGKEEVIVKSKVIKLNAKTKQKAIAFIKKNYPNCEIISIKELLFGKF